MGSGEMNGQAQAIRLTVEQVLVNLTNAIQVAHQDNSDFGKFKAIHDCAIALNRIGDVAAEVAIEDLREMGRVCGVENDSMSRIIDHALANDAFRSTHHMNSGGFYQDATGLLKMVSPDLAPERPRNKIKLRSFDDFIDLQPKDWMIKNVIALGETSAWIAPPGAGKSALLTDIAVHLGRENVQWRGYRIKMRRGAVYFALERAVLTGRRFTAYSRRDGLHGLPIYVAGQIIDLMDKSCVLEIVDVVKQAADLAGCEIGLGIVDAWAKGIAAGGGDENSAKDQNIALANLRRVIDRTGIHFATIGHTGKDVSKGERGSNAKKGDMDLEVTITGDLIKEVTVTKANDQPMGPLTTFTLEPYEFGVDEDGDPFRTYIVSKEIVAATAAANKPLSGKQMLAKKAAIGALLSDKARLAPTEFGLPNGTKVVDFELVRTEMLRNGAVDPDSRNPRARAFELRDALVTRQVIGFRDGVIWVPRQENQ